MVEINKQTLSLYEIIKNSQDNFNKEKANNLEIKSYPKTTVIKKTSVGARRFPSDVKIQHLELGRSRSDIGVSFVIIN